MRKEKSNGASMEERPIFVKNFLTGRRNGSVMARIVSAKPPPMPGNQESIALIDNKSIITEIRIEQMLNSR